MKNNTIETASAFFDDTLFVFDNEASRDYVIQQMVSYHNHLMAEMEKEVSNAEIEKEGNGVYKGGQVQGIYDFYNGAYWIRSKIFDK